jgi:tRNA-Thr(GGU) m(6)t(6)A37 methyltransferase TsaA
LISFNYQNNIETMETVIKYIGKVHSSLTKIEDCPLQESENAPEALIEIFPDFLKGVRNIKPGSEIVLLTWLHQADRSVIECIPRREYGSPPVGVFSTRSPDRPNPIGIHKVKVISVEANGLIKVSALEVLDQTPLIDIKPVLDKL